MADIFDTAELFETFATMRLMMLDPWVSRLDPWVARWLGFGPVGSTMLAISDNLFSFLKIFLVKLRNVQFGIVGAPRNVRHDEVVACWTRGRHVWTRGPVGSMMLAIPDMLSMQNS